MRSTRLAWIAVVSSLAFGRDLQQVDLKLSEIERAGVEDRKEWNRALLGTTIQVPIGCYDLRRDPLSNTIGRESSTGRLVTTRSNTAAFVANSVLGILQANGVRTSTTEGARLFLRLKDLFVEEGNTYVGRADIEYVLLDARGDTLLRTGGPVARSRWGRSYSYDNYMEALTVALHSSVWEFLKSGSQGPVPRAATTTAPPPPLPTSGRKAPHPVAKEFIAVLPLQGNGVDPSVSSTLSDLLVNFMQTKGVYKVLERDQIDKILREQGFQKMEMCTASDCAVEIGKLLSVRKLVVGSIGKLGNSYILNIRMVDVQTGEIVANSSKRITGGIENSADAMASIVDELCD